MRMGEAKSQECRCVTDPQNRVMLLWFPSPRSPLSIRHDQWTVYNAQADLAEADVSRAAGRLRYGNSPKQQAGDDDGVNELTQPGACSQSQWTRSAQGRFSEHGLRHSALLPPSSWLPPAPPVVPQQDLSVAPSQAQASPWHHHGFGNLHLPAVIRVTAGLMRSVRYTAGGLLRTLKNHVQAATPRPPFFPRAPPPSSLCSMPVCLSRVQAVSVTVKLGALKERPGSR